MGWSLMSKLMNLMKLHHAPLIKGWLAAAGVGDPLLIDQLFVRQSRRIFHFNFAISTINYQQEWSKSCGFQSKEIYQKRMCMLKNLLT